MTHYYKVDNKWVSNLVFYTQSAITIISGRVDNKIHMSAHYPPPRKWVWSGPIKFCPGITVKAKTQVMYV